MTNITANATRVRMGRNGSVANSRTILYELRRAVGLPVPDVEWSIPDGRGGVAYADALRHCIDAPAAGGLAEIKAQVASDSRREFMRSDALIVTLGLSDIWEPVGLPTIWNPHVNPYSEMRKVDAQLKRRG